MPLEDNLRTKRAGLQLRVSLSFLLTDSGKTGRIYARPTPFVIAVITTTMTPASITATLGIIPPNGADLSLPMIPPTSTPESVNGLNLYCYCGNDPVNYVDPSGNSIIAICVFIGLSTIIGAAAGAFTAACTGGNILESTIEGAITGLIAATATVFVPQLVALIAPASISAAALTAASTVATFGVAAAGGFATDYVTQRISHKLSGSEDAFDFDRGRAWKTAFMTGIAGIVPTFVDPTKSVLNAMAGATVGMDASFINSVMDVLFTTLL